MDNIIYKKSNIIELIFIFLAFGTLTNTNSYYIPYLMLFLLSILSSTANRQKKIKYFSKENLTVPFFTIIFSLMIILSNYNIIIEKTSLHGINSTYLYIYNLISIVAMMVGLYIGFYNIFYYMKNNSEKICLNDSIKSSPIFIFIFSFILIFTVDILILYLSLYPGVLTSDSTAQLKQAITGNFRNHHPYYHTLIIKFFMDIGIKSFNDINVGLFIYSVFQICLLSSAFSISFSTLDRVKINRKFIYSMLILTIVMPFNIFFSFTIWKDIPFACFVLYYLVFLYRLINRVGNNKINLLIFTIASIGFCLFRSNGLFAYVLSTLFFIFLFAKNNKKIILLMIFSIIFSYTLKNPILKDKNIPPPDIIESLSIPSQQIARVIIENGNISENDRKLVTNVIDIDNIPKIYLSYLSDPIKTAVREKGNQNIIKKNKDEYINLYIHLGLNNPSIYIKAWIDQTKGYWNSGYKYPYYSDIVYKNNFNVKQHTHNLVVLKTAKSYAELFAEHPLLRIFVSIGAAFWSILLMLFISICKKRKLESFLTIPIIMIVASLLIATPVAYEFRYAYSIFVAIPFILGVSLRKDYIIENKNK